MGVINFTAFGGELPVQSERMLPDNFATHAENVWLYSGELRGIRAPINLQAINNITKKVFRIPKGTVGGDPTNPTLVPPPSYLGDSVWMQFTDPDTDIVRGPLINDAFKRFYWCSPTEGPMFNTYSRLLVGDPSYKLGVNAPDVAPNLTVVGGVGALVTRAYVITWKTTYGEESQPSPAVTVTDNVDGSWNLSAIDQPTAGEQLDRSLITHAVVYRTITALSGVATFFKVAEVPIGTTTYNDVLLDTQISGNVQLFSTSFAKPPADLQGFIAMPNGFMVGWKGSDLYVSEPYQPHAWPSEYVNSVEYPVVGLGVWGSTCVIATQGFPASLSGVHPATLSLTKTSVMEPCLSRGSVVSAPDAVYYASQNGLMIVDPSGFRNLTQSLITQQEWADRFRPQYIRAVRYQTGYLALEAVPGDIAPTGFFLDPTDPRVALTDLTGLGEAFNFHNDVWSGEVFLIIKGQVQHWDPPEDERLPYVWKSKEFQLPRPTNFGAVMAFFNLLDYAPYAGGTAIMPADEELRLKVWADRVLKFDQEIIQNGVPRRLPSGFKASIWQFEVRGRVPLYAMHVGSTVEELKRV